MSIVRFYWFGSEDHTGFCTGAWFLIHIPRGVAAAEVEEIVDAQWRDLGMPETLWHCRVKEFGPLIVSIDTEGRNLFEENKVIFNERKDKAIEEICKHVSFIK